MLMQVLMWVYVYIRILIRASFFTYFFVLSATNSARTMATVARDVVDLMEEMNITGSTPGRIKSQDQYTLEETIQKLVRVARETIVDVKLVAQTMENDSPLHQSVAALVSLVRKSSELAVVIQLMKYASADHILARISSLSGRNQDVQ